MVTKDEDAQHLKRIAYYRFWRWEYQRRNDEYIRDFEKYCEPYEWAPFGDKTVQWITPTGAAIPAGLKDRALKFYKKHQRIPPKNPDEGLKSDKALSSEDILDKTINGNFDPEDEVPNDEDLYETFNDMEQGIKVMGYQLPVLGVYLDSYKVKKISKNAPLQMTVTVDLTKDLQYLMQEFEHNYYKIRYFNLLGKDEFKKDRKEYKNNERQSILKLEGWLQKSDRIRINDRNKANVLGLWLYDTEKNNGSVIEAIKNTYPDYNEMWKKKHPQKALSIDWDDVDFTTWARQELRHAKKCIKQEKVLKKAKKT